VNHILTSRHAPSIAPPRVPKEVKGKGKGKVVPVLNLIKH
jgi:hypothetical protein